jgi:hypothetical protein
MNLFICYAKGLNRSGYLLVRLFNLIHSTPRCRSKEVLVCLRSPSTPEPLLGEIYAIRSLSGLIIRIMGNCAESASYTKERGPVGTLANSTSSQVKSVGVSESAL